MTLGIVNLAYVKGYSLGSICVCVYMSAWPYSGYCFGCVRSFVGLFRPTILEIILLSLPRLV